MSIKVSVNLVSCSLFSQGLTAVRHHWSIILSSPKHEGSNEWKAGVGVRVTTVTHRSRHNLNSFSYVQYIQNKALFSADT